MTSVAGLLHSSPVAKLGLRLRPRKVAVLEVMVIWQFIKDKLGVLICRILKYYRCTFNYRYMDV